METGPGGGACFPQANPESDEHRSITLQILLCLTDCLCVIANFGPGQGYFGTAVPRVPLASVALGCSSSISSSSRIAD